MGLFMLLLNLSACSRLIILPASITHAVTRLFRRLHLTVGAVLSFLIIFDTKTNMFNVPKEY